MMIALLLFAVGCTNTGKATDVATEESFIDNDYENGVVDIYSTTGNVMTFQFPLNSVNTINVWNGGGTVELYILSEYGNLKYEYDGKNVRLQGNALLVLAASRMQIFFEGVKPEQYSSSLQALDMPQVGWQKVDNRFVYGCDSEECMSNVVAGVFT